MIKWDRTQKGMSLEWPTGGITRLVHPDSAQCHGDRDVHFFQIQGKHPGFMVESGESQTALSAQTVSQISSA